MIEIGRTYRLRVLKQTDFGVFLDAENLGEILLPNKHTPVGLGVGDFVEVFLYFDSEDRPIATTQTPKAEVGQFAYLKVKENTQIGAFLDWGLDKDLLVPFAEQHRPMVLGDSYIVFLYLDNKGDNKGRITATSKIEKVEMEEPWEELYPEQMVDLIITNSTDLGFKAIVNHSHWGLLFNDEVDQRLSFGQSIQGYVKRVREDGKIDLSLKSSEQKRDSYTQTIQDYLTEHDGYAAAHDKSSPEQISELFGMSKGQFKKAIGALYKQRIIAIEDDGIRLL